MSEGPHAHSTAIPQTAIHRIRHPHRPGSLYKKRGALERLDGSDHVFLRLLGEQLDQQLRRDRLGRGEDERLENRLQLGGAARLRQHFELGVGWTRFDVDGDRADTLELKLRFNF